MKFRLVHALLLVCMTFLFNCDRDKIDNNPLAANDIDSTSFTLVSFDLASGNPGLVPLPNDVLRDPSTGLLALPSFGVPAVDALVAQVNSLNGFSTTSFVRVPFNGDVDTSTVNSGTILVVDLAKLAQLQAGAQVDPLVSMSWSTGSDEAGNPVAYGYPNAPLSPGTPHMVIVTQGVRNEAGLGVDSDLAMLVLKGENEATGEAAALEPLRQAYQAAIWPAAEAITGLDRLFIPAAWVFTTQTQYADLAEMYAKAQAENPVPDVFTAALGAEQVDAVLNLLGQGFLPHANIGGLITGSINMPHYISHPVDGWILNLDNPTREDVNFMATLPAGPSPFGDGTYPTIIYQHGITSNKETMLALADSAASVGFATIAIDLVLHGERGIDLTGDGQINPEAFINATNLLRSRDNLRQSAADLMMVSRMITAGNGDFTGDGVADLNPGAVSFVGVSLGGIVGGSFVATDPAITSAVLNVPGARVPTFLPESGAFGPALLAGLADLGLVPGTALYDIYFMFAQAIVDDGDPANYVPHLTSGNLSGGIPTATLFQEMVGELVIPNSATRYMGHAAGVAQIDAIEAISGMTQAAAPHFGSGYYQFESPADPFTRHGALLSPADGNPTVQMQTQVLTFLGSALLGNPTIINPYGGAKRDLGTELYRSFFVDYENTPMVYFPAK